MTRSAVATRLKQRDKSLRQQILEHLQSTGYHPLRQVDCRVDDGIVHLAGEVPSFYFKQIAQSVVLPLENVRAVENELRVRKD